MNRAWLPYLLLLAFVLLCVAGVAMYVHWVRGVSFFDESAGSRTWLILEILLALLLSVLIGLGLGWWLRDQSAGAWQTRLEQAQREMQTVALERDGLMQSQALAQQQLARYEQRAQEWQAKIDHLENQPPQIIERTLEKPADTTELDLLKFKVRQLEFELDEAKQKAPAVSLPKGKSSDEIELLHQTLSHLRDDLKVIKGIGPVIEKKLNEQGIYTFQQIAEFSAAEIEHISEVLEFFPGRIARDHWVEQAQELFQRKTING
ncbi:MAG: hypothetical protein MUC38_02980 [Cyclobacteriaceae bacterium]|nr:hypothetical protein [Cyclobacteriaceae bacterium]